MNKAIFILMCMLLTPLSMLFGQEDPHMVLSPTELDFIAQQNGQLPTSQIFTISNIGSGTLNWNISDDADWLDENPTAGTTEFYSSDNITVSINATDLAVGTYYATITVGSDNAINGPQDLDVTYQVMDKPLVELRYSTSNWVYTQDPTLTAEIWVQSPVDINGSQLTFKMNRFLFDIDTVFWNTADMNLLMENLHWNADSVFLHNLSGFLDPWDPMFEATVEPLLMATVYMTFKEDSIYCLPAPFYFDSTHAPPAIEFVFIDTFSALIKPNYVTDTLSLQYLASHMTLTPSSLSFDACYTGELPPDQSFRITNQGSDVLNWSISDDADWLDVSPTSGSTHYYSYDDISVSINSTDLDPFIPHSATITVSSDNADNSPQYVDVNYNLYLNGDANDDGWVNISDAVYIINYLYYGGAEPQPYPERGDVDRIPGVSMNDAQLIYNYIFMMGDLPYCPPYADSIPPVSTDTVKIITKPIYPGETEAMIEIWLKAKEEIQAFALPFEYSCTGPGFNLNSVEYGPDINGYAFFCSIDSSSSKAALGYFDLMPEVQFIGPGDILLATLYFEMQSSDVTQYIQLDTTFVETSNRYIFTRWNAANSTTDAFLPVFIEYICGDANNDEEVNVSDAVWMLNYIFLGGPPPDPVHAAEINCDGDPNVSDVVWLLNYIFYPGAPGPCDC
jgi:hypothetical protein